MCVRKKKWNSEKKTFPNGWMVNLFCQFIREKKINSKILSRDTFFQTIYLTRTANDVL